MTNAWPILSGGGRAATPIADVFAPLTNDRRIFAAGGVPWIWGGVSAFPLCDRFARGFDIDPFLRAFDGFNLLRVWDYVPWPGTGWPSQPAETWIAFLAYVGVRGFRVELTLLTDDDPARIAPARRLVEQLAAAHVTNLVLEIGNEPLTHKTIDVEALRGVCERSGFPFASGDNSLDKPHFGSFITHHSPRDDQWQRKGGHDLYEFYNGAGPEGPHAPWEQPATADEPKRPDQDGYHPENYKAYFASCALLGAGATFHFEGGKYGTLPTADEARCAAAALLGLRAFPPGTPNGSPGYHRIDEQGKSLRTYTCADCMVRIPPLTTTEAPEPGWTMIDTEGILWRRHGTRSDADSVSGSAPRLRVEPAAPAAVPRAEPVPDPKGPGRAPRRRR